MLCCRFRAGGGGRSFRARAGASTTNLPPPHNTGTGYVTETQFQQDRDGTSGGGVLSRTCGVSRPPTGLARPAHYVGRVMLGRIASSPGSLGAQVCSHNISSWPNDNYGKFVMVARVRFPRSRLCKPSCARDSLSTQVQPGMVKGGNTTLAEGCS